MCSPLGRVRAHDSQLFPHLSPLPVGEEARNSKKDVIMSIRIDGGVVVGWSGTSHEIVPNGSVLIEGNTVKSVSTDKSQSADRVIDASGKIVCPGFVNLHVHSQLNVGDYLLTDVTKKDYLAANWLSSERRSRRRSNRPRHRLSRWGGSTRFTVRS